MRHHHELPQKGLWNYVLNHEAPPWTPTKRSWNYVLNHEEPPWAPTKRIMELRPKPWSNTMSSHQKGSWNYVLNHEAHYELPPKGSWNYILNHKVPPWSRKRVMELCPKPWGTTMSSHQKGSWNYVLTMRHHHETFMELRPDHTIIMHHLPNIELSWIPIPCQYT